MPSYPEILQLIAERQFDQLETLSLTREQLIDLNDDISTRQADILQELQQISAEDQADQQAAAQNNQAYRPQPALVQRVRERLDELDELARWREMCQFAKLVESGRMTAQQFEGKFPEWLSSMRAAPRLQERVQQNKISPFNPKPTPGATRAYTPQELQILRRNPAAMIFAEGLAASQVVHDARQSHQEQKQEDMQQKVEDAVEKLDAVEDLIEATSGEVMEAAHATVSAAIEPVASMAIGGIVAAVNDLEGGPKR